MIQNEPYCWMILYCKKIKNTIICVWSAMIPRQFNWMWIFRNFIIVSKETKVKEFPWLCQHLSLDFTNVGVYISGVCGMFVYVCVCVVCLCACEDQRLMPSAFFNPFPLNLLKQCFIPAPRTLIGSFLVSTRDLNCVLSIYLSTITLSLL